MDEVLRGGFPAGKTTLAIGGPGCGKTILAARFLGHGAVDHDEPGVFVSFEETKEDLTGNLSGLRLGLNRALGENKLSIEHVPIAGSRITQAGDYTLDGFLAMLERWLSDIKAKRLVLDNLNSLLAQYKNSQNLRYELARVIAWTKQQGITTVITSELHDMSHHRFTMEEFATDCVILLDHRVQGQVSKRRMRVVKCRGSAHSADEFPFLISPDGLSVLPITSISLDFPSSNEFVSTGVAGLDQMLDGKGFYRGSTVMISGVAGTGKSTLAARIAEKTCAAGGRCLYLPFEEASSQIVRNMASVGIDLGRWIENGSLLTEPMRPTNFGLEEHLLRIHRLVDEFKPDTVVMDPITSFLPIGSEWDIRSMLTRLIDFFKMQGINTLMTCLVPGEYSPEQSMTEVSSIVDTWVVINYHRQSGERKRYIYVHKARGIAHSQGVWELLLSGKGPEVKPAKLEFGGAI
ncbi:MAG: circadian clock protein KaiC [Desulfarculaceae bacterium]|nr:circadian clock protein KaiC [Desulfarculaceae bacterium]